MTSATYKKFSPKQPYLTIAQIHEKFGSRAVVAYSCKIVDKVLEGGAIIAVANAPDSDPTELKEYQKKLKKQHPDKHPVLFLRVEKDEKFNRIILTYDYGNGEKKVAPMLEVKKTEAEEKIETVPVEFLAQALSAATKNTN